MHQIDENICFISRLVINTLKSRKGLAEGWKKPVSVKI